MSLNCSLLTALGARLKARGVQGSVYVVGGAAISTTFDDGRRLTSDIDAMASPADIIAVEAALLAIERDLPPNWLNSNAKPWIPSPSSDTGATVTEIPGLTVTIASPRHLLAMKMVAFRTIDRSDLVRLFERLHIQTPEEAADIVDEVYGVENLANPVAKSRSSAPGPCSPLRRRRPAPHAIAAPGTKDGQPTDVSPSSTATRRRSSSTIRAPTDPHGLGGESSTVTSDSAELVGGLVAETARTGV